MSNVATPPYSKPFDGVVQQSTGPFWTRVSTTRPLTIVCRVAVTWNQACRPVQVYGTLIGPAALAAVALAVKDQVAERPLMSSAS